MENFNLAVSYVWEFDEEFVSLIENTLRKAGISTFLIKEHNVFEVTERVKNNELAFDFYLDRASDADDDFAELAVLLDNKKTVIINPYEKVHHAIDKASMHLEFISAGLIVPYSIIVPPHSEEEEYYVSIDDLSMLGRPFIIKPCNNTGGGIGVVTGAETLKDVLEERATNSEDKYLLQQKIYPAKINDRRAWFRSFRAFGKSIPVWWDDQTHIYEAFRQDEKRRIIYKKLKKITEKIAEITQLDFFSTEVVITEENEYVVIDYVNDQCDMRPKSIHPDGVPDNIISDIVNNLKRYITGHVD